VAALPALPRAAMRIALPVLLAVALTASASGVTLIRVHRGDTLSEIAQRYHTTVAALVRLNDLPGDGNLIIAGQQLRVPSGHPQAPHHHRAHHRRAHRHRAHHRRGSHLVVTHHVVVSGDTLYGIAVRYHASAARIARRNHLPRSLTVVIGQRLAIPHRVRTAADHRHHVRHRSRRGLTRAERDRAYLASRHVPSRHRTATLIRATARRWEVDPSLALAIAWQESGWSMRAVSPVDALGAMQVMRYTGAYLSANVVHRHLNLYNPRDNITAGVALLAVLTREARSTREAIAGYYQGLQSVRDHGMYTSTKQYVADVTSLKNGF
jgi:N-acetylmuramoyl-L-alanine amidase